MRGLTWLFFNAAADHLFDFGVAQFERLKKSLNADFIEKHTASTTAVRMFSYSAAQAV